MPEITLDRIVKCFDKNGLWIISFDPTDADGYKMVALQYNIFVEQNNPNKKFYIFYSSKACPTNEVRMSKPTDTECDCQDEEQKELECVASLLSQLTPNAILVTGSRHVNSPLPLKFVKNAHEVYSELSGPNTITIIDIETAAFQIKEHLEKYPINKICMDFVGCIGYFPKIKSLIGETKLAKGLEGQIILVMGGILEEFPPQTMALPGRHPYTTMNQLYDKVATKEFYDFCIKYNQPLLFCTNTKTNEFAKFIDDEDMNGAEKMTGLLAKITSKWFGPHLKGKYVDFDTFAFCCYVLMMLDSTAVDYEVRYLHLYDNPAINLLSKKSDPISLENTVAVDSSLKVFSVNKVTQNWLDIIDIILSQK